MSREWRNRQKEIQGKRTLLGYDVLSFGTTALSGAASHTSLTNPNTISQITAPRGGFVDFVSIDVSPAISSGSLSLSVSHGGSVIASGDLTSGSILERVYDHKRNNLPVVASGSVTEAAYVVGTALNEDGTQGYSINARVGLRYREAAS